MDSGGTDPLGVGAGLSKYTSCDFRKRLFTRSKNLCSILRSVCHHSSTIKFNIALSRAPNGNNRGAGDIICVSC